VCDPGSHHGSPFEVFPSTSAVPHHRAVRHWKALHDNASVRAFFGSPRQACARASLRFQLPGLSTCLPGAVIFKSDHRNGLTWSRPLSPFRVHLASPALRVRLRIAPSPFTSCRVPLRAPARPQGLDPWWGPLWSITLPCSLTR